MIEIICNIGKRYFQASSTCGNVTLYWLLYRDSFPFSNIIHDRLARAYVIVRFQCKSRFRSFFCELLKLIRKISRLLGDIDNFIKYTFINKYLLLYAILFIAFNQFLIPEENSPYQHAIPKENKSHCLSYWISICN